MSQLTIPINYSFYGGAVPASAETPWFLPVSINGRAYLIDTRQYRRATVEAQRAQVDEGAEPSEQSLSSTGQWKRTQHDWRGGAGQAYFDLDRDDRRDRFWSSKGLEVFADRGLSLLNDTQLKTGFPSGSFRLLSVAGVLFAWSPSVLYRVDAPHNTAPSLVAITVTGTINAVATDGANLYLATSDGIRRVIGLTTTTSASWSAFVADGLWVANGRLIATSLGRIVEVDSDGEVGLEGQLDWIHPLGDAWRWTAGLGASNYIVMGGTTADQGGVFAIPLDEAGLLLPPMPSASLPAGERLTCAKAYTNLVLVGTTRGVRLGLLEADGTLRYGPAIEVGEVLDMEGRGEFVVFTWSYYDDTSCGLGRADLSRFTEELVPAYSSFLMTDDHSSVVLSTTFCAGRWYFTTLGGVCGEIDELVASGSLVSSEMSFGTFELKAGRYVTARHDPLHGSVFLSARNESGRVINLGASGVQGSLGPESAWRLGMSRLERLTMIVTLERDEDDPSIGPKLRRWTTSIVPTPQRVDQFLVPIVLHTKVVNDQGDGAEHYQDTKAEFEHLKSLEAAKNIVVYQEGHTGYEVYIDGLEMRPEKWNDERSFFEGLLFVRLLTTKPE
jgi:hypothetical protein